MRAPTIGSVSGGGPVTRPRMMSVDCCAAAALGTEAASRAPPKPRRRAQGRVFTTTIYGTGAEKVARTGSPALRDRLESPRQLPRISRLWPARRAPEALRPEAASWRTGLLLVDILLERLN